MLIASAILIHARLVDAVDVMWHSIRIWAELHDAEGCAGPWKGMPHAVGPYDGVDVLDVIGSIVAVSVLADGWLMTAANGQ